LHSRGLCAALDSTSDQDDDAYEAFRGSSGMDLGAWLRGLGLGRYEAAFRENEIDERVLRSLTQEDLKEIGVGPVGHRRMLLDAIAALRPDAGAKAAAADAVARSTTPSASAEDRAERRQVTVMFVDLVGSTALSARMDPEDLREVISVYQKCVADTVQRFGGFVAKYMGDGVLVYFGYPQAHEDDAERAVQAGLELVAAVSDLKTHAILQTRVGIATGLVVVGDLIGSGASQEQAIVGETPNLAARLQGVAEPNSVVIAESTRKLVGDLFELEDLGSQELKGISGAVRLWAALRQGSVEGRFEAFHASGLTDLVGREEELELLLRRWSRAKTGEGQVVLVSGEAGIGKSRLTAALLERLAAEPHSRLRYFCSPQHTDSAFYTIISQIERAAGFTHDDASQVKLDKLDALSARNFTPREDAALLVEMLSLPNDGRYPIFEIDPQQRRQKTLEAFTRQIETLSRSNPVLIVFEDVHWIDPTSFELLGRTVERLKALKVLLVITHRPEFEPPWVGRPYVSALNLNRLGEREIIALIDRVTGNKSLPASVRLDIIERTDGIPLFVEEMTKAVLEAESEGDTRKTASSVPSSALAVPASLHASLMARLDRLGSAKDLAQTGAAIGREFSHALLAAVSDKPEAELKSALDRLEGAGLLFRQGMPPHAAYLFKHALVQDAAYSTLLREPRRALHSQIVETLENEFPEIAESQPEILARHCTEAGLIEKAAGLWGKAGLRSLERSAAVEAIEQLTRALAQIASQPGTPALRREQIKFQVGLMNALMHTKGQAAPETKAAAERAHQSIENAEALGESPEDPLLLFSVQWGFWVANLVAFNGDVMRELAGELLTLAEKQGASVPLMVAHRSIGLSLLHTGDIAQCRPHFDRAIALYDPVKHRPLAPRFGGDIGATALAWRSVALWILGYPVSAQADAEDALSTARETRHAVTLMYALTHVSMTHFCCGNYTRASAEADELVTLAGEKGSTMWKAYGASRQGFLAAMTDKAADAVQIITSAIDTARSIGSTLWTPLNLSHLARAYAALGELDDAWRCIGEAMTAMATAKETWWEAEVNRIAGEVSLMLPEPDAAKAQNHYERALAVARQQQAKSWELRAAISLARLWRSQGNVQQARELLAPIYGWFTEGFDTRDLKEAKALLNELQ
jgi:class 3 adenylate cyclase/predicted ATPase